MGPRRRWPNRRHLRAYPTWLLAGLLALAMTLAACSKSGEIDAADSSTNRSAENAEVAQEEQRTTSSAPVTATTTEAAQAANRYPQAVPIGEPTTVRQFGSTWTVTTEGIVALGDDTADRRCIALVGSIELTELEGRDLFADPPQAMAVAASGNADSEYDRCDDVTGSLTDLGYLSLSDADLLPGTSYPFFVPFRLGTSDSAGAEVVGLGSTDSGGTVWFEATAATELESASVVSTGSLPVEVLPATDEQVDVATTFDARVGVEVAGLVETPPRPDAEPGRCFSIVGWIHIDDPAETLVLETGVIADGRWIRSWHNRSCDQAAVLGPAGFPEEFELFGEGVAQQGRYPVSFDLFVPGLEPGIPAVTVIGSPIFDEAMYFETVLLDGPPEP